MPNKFKLKWSILICCGLVFVLGALLLNIGSGNGVEFVPDAFSGEPDPCVICKTDEDCSEGFCFIADDGVLGDLHLELPIGTIGNNTCGVCVCLSDAEECTEATQCCNGGCYSLIIPRRLQTAENNSIPENVCGPYPCVNEPEDNCPPLFSCNISTGECEYAVQ